MRFIIFITFITSLIYFAQLPAWSTTPEKLPVVEITRAKLTNVSQVITGHGIIEPIHGVTIEPEVAGVVTSIKFRSGQKIAAGQVLLELDHQDVSAELAQEIAKRDYLIRNFKRYIILANKGIITRDNLDKLRSELTAEKAKVVELTAILAKRVIRAPFSGMLGLKQVSVGQYLQPGNEIVSLQQNQAMLLDISVPLEQSANIHVGELVKITLSASLNTQGKIVAIDSRINDKIYALKVRIKVDNANQQILPGDFVTAKIFLPNKLSVITLPQSAVKYDLSGESVFIVRNQHAYQMAVQGEVMNDEIIIKQGLKPNEQVVIAGQEKLYDGMAVNAKLQN